MSFLRHHEIWCAAGGLAVGLALPSLARALRGALRRGGKRVAVVLSGCGVFDGSEVTEAVAVLIHLQKAGAEVAFFAPDMPQAHHVLHHSKTRVLCPPLSQRSVLEESARITRGRVESLSRLAAKDFDALVFPGGFGVGKNLSTFAFQPDFTVHSEVERVIHDFNQAGKPIGLCCIAPVLAAKCISGVELTVGSAAKSDRWPYADTAAAIQKCGAQHVEKDVGEVHVDLANKVVTTPAYMCEASAAEVYDGIGRMVCHVLRLA